MVWKQKIHTGIGPGAFVLFPGHTSFLASQTESTLDFQGTVVDPPSRRYARLFVDQNLL